MRLLFSIAIFCLLIHGICHGQNQREKLMGFVIGNTAKEKYTIYFNGQWLMTVSAEAYKVAFEVDRLSSWERTKYIREFKILRKTFFGRMRRVAFEVEYDPNKKYLIISREAGRRKSKAFVGKWSDEEPAMPPAKRK